jgi:hypothetical protein
MGQIALTVTVLTSDDVEFVLGVSDPVRDHASMNTAVTQLYEKVFKPLAQRPSLYIPFIPFIPSVGADEFIDVLNRLVSGVPCFGSVAFSDDPNFQHIYTLANDAYYTSSFVLLGLVGNVKPTFFQASVPEDSIVKQKALVTGSNHNLLTSINNNPASNFFKSVGFFDNGAYTGLSSLSLVFDLDDGSRQFRACILGTEDGSLLLCGNVPIGSALSFAIMSTEDVIDGAHTLAETAKLAAQGKGVLAYSCAARSWALGLSDLAEHEEFQKVLGSETPYTVAYVGGEIYPTRLNDGSMISLLQNDSLIVCVL